MRLQLLNSSSLPTPFLSCDVSILYPSLRLDLDVPVFVRASQGVNVPMPMHLRLSTSV